MPMLHWRGSSLSNCFLELQTSVLIDSQSSSTALLRMAIKVRPRKFDMQASNLYHPRSRFAGNDNLADFGKPAHSGCSCQFDRGFGFGFGHHRMLRAAVEEFLDMEAGHEHRDSWNPTAMSIVKQRSPIRSEERGRKLTTSFIFRDNP